MKRLQTPADAVTAEVNLSPLIDVVFLLLIFFMVTTVFVEDSGVDIERPGATTAGPADKSSIRLALTADGRIVAAGRDVGLNDLRGLLERKSGGDARPVLIEADRRAATGRLLQVIDECRAAELPYLVATAGEDAP